MEKNCWGNLVTVPVVSAIEIFAACEQIIMIQDRMKKKFLTPKQAGTRIIFFVFVVCYGTLIVDHPLNCMLDFENWGGKRKKQFVLKFNLLCVMIMCLGGENSCSFDFVWFRVLIKTKAKYNFFFLFWFKNLFYLFFSSWLLEEKRESHLKFVRKEKIIGWVIFLWSNSFLVSRGLI